MRVADVLFRFEHAGAMLLQRSTGLERRLASIFHLTCSAGALHLNMQATGNPSARSPPKAVTGLVSNGIGVRGDSNARVCTELLQTTRGVYVALDETYWRPTYACISGLQDAEKHTVVGGRWKAGEDWSAMDTSVQFPEKKQSRLAIHFVVSVLNRDHGTPFYDPD